MNLLAFRGFAVGAPIALAAPLVAAFAAGDDAAPVRDESSQSTSSISPQQAKILACMRGEGPREPHLILRGEIEVPATLHDPSQGRVTRRFAAVLAPDVNAFQSDTVRFDAPGYRDPAVPGYAELDYDEAENLILWRTEEAHGWVSGDMNRRYETLLKTLIHPSGRFEGFEWHHRAQLFADGSRDALYELDQILWASGRGFADSIRTILHEAPAPEGRLEWLVECAGPLPGRWRLEIDPAAGYLVRSAAYLAAGGEEPSVTVITGGQIAGKGLAAKWGTIRFGSDDARPFEISVRFRAAEREDGTALLEEIRARVLGPLPAGESVLIDQRRSPPEHTYP